MALLGIRFLCRNLRILEACAPNRSFVLENMSTKPVGKKRRGEGQMIKVTPMPTADNIYSNKLRQNQQPW